MKKNIKNTVLIVLCVLLAGYAVWQRLAAAETPFGVLLVLLGIGLYVLVDWGISKWIQESLQDAPFLEDLKEEE